jgi:ribonuclease HI
MELQACIEALKIATGRRPRFEQHRYRKIIIFTDSTYLQNHYTTAMFTWSRNGWLKKDGSPADNAKQWRELVGLLRKASNQRKPVEIRWVLGKKTPRTKAVDKQAKKSAELASIRQLTPFQVRRKASTRELERGSVKMSGQKLTIRITKVEVQPLHKLTKYWYEVLSKKSPFHGRRDVIYAEPSILMRAGHSYFVRLNQDTGNPRIVKVFREIES